MEKVVLKMVEAMKFVPADNNAAFESLSPKHKMLYAVAECAGMTTMMILGKTDIKLDSFEVEVEGVLSENAIAAQSVFTSFMVRFNIASDRIEDHSRINNAIEMSHNKYCGMIRMMRMIAPVGFDSYIRVPKTTAI